MEIWERMLNPAVVWVFIPILAIVFWGTASVIRAIRGVPEDVQEYQSALTQLQARVEKLEQVQQVSRASTASA